MILKINDELGDYQQNTSTSSDQLYRICSECPRHTVENLTSPKSMIDGHFNLTSRFSLSIIWTTGLFFLISVLNFSSYVINSLTTARYMNKAMKTLVLKLRQGSNVRVWYIKRSWRFVSRIMWTELQLSMSSLSNGQMVLLNIFSPNVCYSV